MLYLFTCGTHCRYIEKVASFSNGFYLLSKQNHKELVSNKYLAVGITHKLSVMPSISLVCIKSCFDLSFYNEYVWSGPISLLFFSAVGFEDCVQVA